MSVRMAYLSPSSTKPMATPPTWVGRGTPASMSASEAPQTVAWELEPLDSRMSLTTRRVYGNFSSSGMSAVSARSASAPWPISRRPGPRMKPVSPTLKGGKL